MEQQKGLKLRNVLSDPMEEDLCLEDVIMELAACSEKFRFLEYRNKPHSYKEALKAFNKAKKKFKEFETRFKGEIKESIFIAYSRIDKRVDPKKPEEFDSFLDD